jgi:hypothetical protein
VIVADPVKRRRQVRVQNPGPARGGASAALARLEDGRDRVMAAAAGPEPIRPRLEPRFPLGFQRVSDPALVAAVRDDWDGDFILPLLQ